jgi:hypothetical protein
MKIKPILLALSVLCLAQPSLQVGEVAAEASENISKKVKRIIVNFEESIKELVVWFMDDDRMLDNNNFYKAQFVNVLNDSFKRVENKKQIIYENIKYILDKAYRMSKLEKSFDLSLSNEDQMMMKFVINLDKNLRTPDMKKYWHKALSAKNGMFSSIELLKNSIVQCSINLVNFYDNMEAFYNESKYDDDNDSDITLKNVKQFKYITGFMDRMKEMYVTQNEIFKEINQNMLSVNTDILEWNRAFKELKGYMDDFMTGRIKVEEKVEEQMLKDMETQVGQEMAAADVNDGVTEFQPKEDEDYKPESETQKNSENPDKYKELEGIDFNAISDPAELERLQKLKEQQERDEIEHLAITRIKEMETAINNEELESQKKKLEGELMETAESVKTCNKVLLMNYFLDGHIEATPISLDDPIPGCPDIRHSCCSKEEVERSQRMFLDELLPRYSKKFYLIRKVVKVILKNYAKFIDLAYDTMKIRGADPVCHQSAENVIFTPIGLHFVNTFFKKLEKAHKWLLKAKSGYFCMLCDQRNHHTIFEFNQLIFQREFCQSMIDNTFDFTSVWYMNFTDFFNNLLELLQCDKHAGKYSQDVVIDPFGAGPRGKEIIKNCIKKERSFCVDYCSTFNISDMNSFSDINIERITNFYEFVLFRMNDYYKMEIKSNIDTELFHMVDDQVITERFSEGYIRLDSPNKVFSKKFDDSNANNPILYGASDEAIVESIFAK